MSRINNVTKNLKYAIVGQILGVLISFISRMVFIRTLGAEYLGLNGLFTNILSILSLAELGIGPAMIYSMYKPLAEKNEEKIKSLMHLYKRSYITVGVIILVIGTLITPFINYFIKEMPDIENIKIIYIMFVFNSSISYFFSYKRSLIIADQKRYIATLYRYGFYFILNVLQIVLLILTGNYFIYLILLMLNTLLENVFISRKANQLYPFLRDKHILKLQDDEKKPIVQNVKAMMYHKLGTTVVMGTDNLLISKFIGLVEVGLYSNYHLISNSLNMMFGLFFQSLTASIGNLGASESGQKKIFIFNVINLAGYWIYAFASICLLVLFNPFISLWVGGEYLFSSGIVFLIIINFYLTGMRKSVLTYRDALGLFWYDRYKPIFEAALNLIFSLVLVKYLGISGIFLGTTLSTILVCLWIEPLVLYKYGFEKSAKPYFVTYIKFAVLTLVVGGITWFVSSFLPLHGVSGFIVKIVICMIVPNSLFFIFFRKTEEFKYLYSIVKKKSFL